MAAIPLAVLVVKPSCAFKSKMWVASSAPQRVYWSAFPLDNPVGFPLMSDAQYRAMIEDMNRDLLSGSAVGTPKGFMSNGA